MINEYFSVVLSVFAASAAGLVGAFALMKKTVLAGDVMSHLAIPGLGLALLWSLNPILGGGTTLILGAIVIWQLEKKTTLSSDAAIGVIFASSVALGALLINSEEDLIDALFGGFVKLSLNEFIFGMAVSIFVIVMLWILRNKLIIALFSEDLAAAMNIKTSSVNLWFLLLFALTILSGLQFLGALLAGSLIIIPAAAARQVTHSLGQFLAYSAIFAALSVVAGFALSSAYELELGPTVVVVAAAIFAVAAIKRKK
ncbi:MAG: metal ABC transporter permease [Patescibacteria group bacterium]